MSNESKGVRKEVKRSNLTVSRVYLGNFQKQGDGAITAELKQTITTDSYYPTKSVTSKFQDNPFSMSDFGYEEKSYSNNETRVAWIDVPEGTTLEQVQSILDKSKEAMLYRILSNRPILTEQQEYSVQSDEYTTSMADFANSQAIRYPKGTDKEGQLALDKNGKIQYRAIFYSTKAIEDIDLRTEEPSDFFASDELKAEINSTAHVVVGQEL